MTGVLVQPESKTNSLRPNANGLLTAMRTEWWVAGSALKSVFVKDRSDWFELLGPWWSSRLHLFISVWLPLSSEMRMQLPTAVSFMSVSTAVGTVWYQSLVRSSGKGIHSRFEGLSNHGNYWVLRFDSSFFWDCGEGGFIKSNCFQIFGFKEGVCLSKGGLEDIIVGAESS